MKDRLHISFTDKKKWVKCFFLLDNSNMTCKQPSRSTNTWLLCTRKYREVQHCGVFSDAVLHPTFWSTKNPAQGSWRRGWEHSCALGQWDGFSQAAASPTPGCWLSPPHLTCCQLQHSSASCPNCRKTSENFAAGLVSWGVLGISEARAWTGEGNPVAEEMDMGCKGWRRQRKQKNSFNSLGFAVGDGHAGWIAAAFSYVC